MRRRSRASSKPTKARSRKAKVPNAVRHSSSFASGQETEVVRLRRELDEAREQQAATADVLKSISRSTFDLKAVLDTLAESAAAVCEALNATIYLRDEDFAITGAHFGPLPLGGTPIGTRQALNINWLSGRAVLEARTIHVADLSKSDEYPEGKELARRFGHRTTLTVPLLRDQKAIGGICVRRREVRPFTDKQIAQVQNFAAQAVIAIENTRLLSELRESLDHQTATADILRVIASTPEDSNRALDTIAQTAAKMFDAANVHFRRVEGDVLRIIGAAGPTAAKVREALPDFPLEPPDLTDPAVRCVFENRQIIFEDRRAALASERGKITQVYRDLPVGSQAFTPLSRQGEAIGLMIVTRSEVRPFRGTVSGRAVLEGRTVHIP